MGILDFIKTTAMACLAVALTACATRPVYDIGPLTTPAGLGSATTVVVEDKRPADDKAFSFGSMFVGSSSYCIWTLGDETFTPPMMDALRLSVMQAAATSQHMPQRVVIRVDRLIVQDNEQAFCLATASSGLGPLGVVVGEAFHGKPIELSIEKSRPFIIALFKGAVTVDGNTRDLVVTKANNWTTGDKQDRGKAIQDTLRAFLKTLGEEAMGAPTNAPRPDRNRTTIDSRIPAPGQSVASDGAGSKSVREKTADQKMGKHSYAVEKMAGAAGCNGGSGAYLTTESGPIEDYRIDCEDGATYLARCEYGTCTRR
jgi:hypothetical protein